MTGVRGLSRTDFVFLFCLLALLVVYAVHFLSFTLFEGFSTFSNDAGSYVVLARKWSPFFPPSDAELYTWPIQSLPPGFAWALAITGASESLWTSHLLVSLCMLASIFLVGWMAYRRLGWLIGGILILGLCLLPGVIISSMGILSENLYLLLSLIVLILYSFIKRNTNASWTLYLLLLIFLALVILTRTIGIALILAVFLVTLFDKQLSKEQKNGFYVLVFSSIAFWMLWNVVNPQTSDFTYGANLKHHIGTDVTIYGVFAFLWRNFNINLMQILSSWNHYLSLSHSNVWFFLFSYILLIPCLLGLSLRFLQGRLDAIYLVLYFAILLIWPFPTQMTRFLHPIIFLLILQPVFYYAGKSKIRSQHLAKATLIIVILSLITNSIVIQVRLLEQRISTSKTYPELTHSYELYDSPSRETGLARASIFMDIMKYMEMSAQRIPVHSVVSTVKPVNYSILANRRAVYLVAVVPYLQQLCNLKIKDVDAVFLSPLTTKFNQEGHSQLEIFKNISSNVWAMKGKDREVDAYKLDIDKTKLNSKLMEEGYNCQSFQSHL